MSSLREIEIEVCDIRTQFKIAKERFESETKAFESREKELFRQKDLLLLNYDVGRIQNAEKIISIKGFKDCYGRGDTERKLNESILDVSTGFTHLRKQSYACKDYEGFVCQGSDCDYGMSPRHGYIVFSIELREQYRRQDLSDSFIEDILYYLGNLKKKEFRDLINK